MCGTLYVVCYGYANRLVALGYGDIVRDGGFHKPPPSLPYTYHRRLLDFDSLTLLPPRRPISEIIG